MKTVYQFKSQGDRTIKIISATAVKVELNGAISALEPTEGVITIDLREGDSLETIMDTSVSYVDGLRGMDSLVSISGPIEARETIDHVLEGCSKLTDVSADLFARCSMDINRAIETFANCVRLHSDALKALSVFDDLYILDKTFFNSGIRYVAKRNFTLKTSKRLQLLSTFANCNQLMVLTSDVFKSYNIAQLDKTFANCKEFRGALDELFTQCGDAHTEFKETFLNDTKASFSPNVLSFFKEGVNTTSVFKGCKLNLNRFE